MATKAGLAKQLRSRGIPVPKDGKVADYQHRLDTWLPGKGYVVRLAKPSSRIPDLEHPIHMLTSKQDTYWLPNSEMAQQIVGTRLVFVLARTTEPSKDTVIIDTPRVSDGSHNGADS